MRQARCPDGNDLGLRRFSFSSEAEDIVVMKNGDHFTGEVKRLQDGLLYIETDYVSGNIGLDWAQVQSVQSTAVYQIVLNNGQRLEGKIEKESQEAGKPENFLIHEATGGSPGRVGRGYQA